MSWHLVKDRTVVESRDTLPDSWGGLSQLQLRSPDELQRFGIYCGVEEGAPAFDSDSEQLAVVPFFDPVRNEVCERFQRRPLPAAIALRLKCKAVLKACEWTVLSDAPLLAAGKTAWLNYRTAIRALPAASVDPANPTWPVPPPTRGELDP